MPSKRSRGVLFDLAMAGVILLVGWVYTFGLERFLDIGLYDESLYLRRGLSVPEGLPSAENAPLYAVWYYGLSFFRTDPVDLYYLSYKALTVLPALALFVALRVHRISREIAFLTSLGLLVSSVNFPTWPKVSHFALMILLGGVAATGRLRDRTWQATALAGAALLGSYVRPELFVSLLLLVCLGGFFAFRAAREASSLRPAIPLLGLVLASCLGWAWLGSPLGSGERSMMAFGQHYARNWVSWHQDPRDPWTHWEAIVEEDFGDVASPVEALGANPSAMLRHASWNLRALPVQLRTRFGFPYPRNPATDIAFLLTSTLVLLLVFLHRGRRSLHAWRARIRDNARHYRVHALLLACLVVPYLVSVVWIAPRAHYLLVLGTLLIVAGILLLFRTPSREPRPTSSRHLAVLCLLAVLLTRPIAQGRAAATPQETLRTIYALRSLEITRPVDILEAEGGYGIYLGGQYRRVAPYDKDQRFGSFFEEESIDLVVLSDRLRTDPRFAEDPEWRAFLRDPSEWGFIPLDIPGVPRRSLLVRRSLLPPDLLQVSRHRASSSTIGRAGS